MPVRAGFVVACRGGLDRVCRHRRRGVFVCGVHFVGRHLGDQGAAGRADLPQRHRGLDEAAALCCDDMAALVFADGAGGGGQMTLRGIDADNSPNLLATRRTGLPFPLRCAILNNGWRKPSIRDMSVYTVLRVWW